MKHYLVWKEDVHKDGQVVSLEDGLNLSSPALEGILKSWMFLNKIEISSIDEIELHITQIIFNNVTHVVKGIKCTSFHIDKYPIGFSEDRLSPEYKKINQSEDEEIL